MSVRRFILTHYVG